MEENNMSKKNKREELLQRFESKSMIRIEDELRNINIKGENILNSN